jgi:hypothetical protein
MKEKRESVSAAAHVRETKKMITLNQLMFRPHAKAHAAAYKMHSAIIKWTLKK